MAGHDIVVIGASAGGIQALQELFGGIARDLLASFFVVVHTAPTSARLLPQIIGRMAPLIAEYARDDMPIRHRRIYVAPPDHHLILKGDRMRVVRGPKENGFRPAVDPLFRTAANTYGPQVLGVILSGGLDDGTVGLMQIKQQGGIAIVQDPEEAPFPSMPTSAVQHVAVDHVVTIAAMPALLERLIHTPPPPGVEHMPTKAEPDVAELGSEALASGELPYPPSPFTCPECGGALWELKDGKLMRFRCHNGHGYTAESLGAEQANGLEAALWTALRALEENAALRRRMARRASSGKFKRIADAYAKQAEEAEARAAVIRKVLVSEPSKVKKMKGAKPKPGVLARTEKGRPKRGNSDSSSARNATSRRSQLIS
jgi:two-component system chemotaxis response regulator CheB